MPAAVRAISCAISTNRLRPFLDRAREVGGVHRHRVAEERAVERGGDQVVLERAERGVLGPGALQVAQPLAERDGEQPPHAGAVQRPSLFPANRTPAA